MRALATALLLAALAAPAAEARAPARALLVECERGAELADRAGVFEAEMRSLPGAARMEMRFTLQASTPERERWTRVDAPGFRTWLTADPGTSRWVYTKRVEQLLAPAAYRVRVHFRWLDVAGDTVRRARRNSRRCRQPDPRADLGVRSLDVAPAARPGRSLYTAFVRNSGRSAADASVLSIVAGGVLLPAGAVPALEPREGAYVTVEGPACAPGADLVADADAEESVDERDEADNRYAGTCPS